jgi:hypothetical protein
MGMMERVVRDIAREVIPNVIFSKKVDSGEDVCPHMWDLVRERHGIQVYRCLLNGCLGFRFQHRTEIHKFVRFLRERPKIPVKLPVEDAFCSDEEIARRINSDPRTVKKYFEVVDGLDIDGSPAYIKADGRIFYYRDDLSPLLNVPTGVEHAEHYAQPRINHAEDVIQLSRCCFVPFENGTAPYTFRCPLCGRLYFECPYCGTVRPIYDTPAFHCYSCNRFFTECVKCSGWAVSDGGVFHCLFCGNNQDKPYAHYWWRYGEKEYFRRRIATP